MSEFDSPVDPPPGDLVRSFMVTGGRTTSATPDLSVETIVHRADDSAAASQTQQFEARNVYDYLDEGQSIAEVAAHFKLPILATLVLVGDMVAEGVLVPSELAEVIDAEFLMRIRRRIEVI